MLLDARTIVNRCGPRPKDLLGGPNATIEVALPRTLLGGPW